MTDRVVACDESQRRKKNKTNYVQHPFGTDEYIPVRLRAECAHLAGAI